MRSLSALLLLALSPAALAINLNAPLNPDPVRTPGDVLTSDPRVVCVSGYTKTVRNVPQALKEQVYRSYGITSRQSGEYEIDHLISLELGGSNSVRNLWPESYKTTPLNAHVKDTLENKLHALACSGKITLQQAQQAIASNWQAAYVQYVGPLPGGVTPPPAPKPGQTSGAATVPVLPTSTPPSPPQVSPPVAATTPVPAPTATSVAPSGGACPANAPIKGNIGSNGKIYHLPGDRYYVRTHAEACFATPTAAQAAGFRASR